MRCGTWVVLGLTLGTVASVAAKGDGVGVQMRGRIAKVAAAGEAIQFELTGTLELTQYHGQERSAITVEPTGPIRVRARQSAFCFVMIDDSSWNPGPCRPGQIRKVLERAAREARPLRLELGDVTLHFAERTPEVVDAEVIRVFDDKPAR